MLGLPGFPKPVPARTLHLPWVDFPHCLRAVLPPTLPRCSGSGAAGSPPKRPEPPASSSREGRRRRDRPLPAPRRTASIGQSRSVTILRIVSASGSARRPPPQGRCPPPASTGTGQSSWPVLDEVPTRFRLRSQVAHPASLQGVWTDDRYLTRLVHRLRGRRRLIRHIGRRHRRGRGSVLR